MSLGVRTQLLPMIIVRKIKFDNARIMTLAVSCLLPGSNITGCAIFVLFIRVMAQRVFSIGTRNIHVQVQADAGAKKSQRAATESSQMDKKVKANYF